MASFEREGDTGRLDAVNRVMEEGDRLNEGNPWAGSNKRRDKLRRCLGYWAAAGADKTTLSWIGFGVRLRMRTEPPRISFANHKSYHDEKEHIEAEHATHVADGSFRVVSGSEVHVGNPLQVEVNETKVPRKARMCLDSRFTNAHLAQYDFTQETLNKHVAQIIPRGALMITTDVEKAYYQVPLHKDSQRYCAWRHNEQWIVPTILAFGLSVAPFVFTKLMRVLLKFARKLDITGSNCIDDNIWAEDAARMPDMRATIQVLFGKLGWVFNAKCVFNPSTQVIYNGMWIDSVAFQIRAPDDKIDAIKKLVWRVYKTAAALEQPVRLVELQQIAGQLQSLKLALEGVAVWTRAIYAIIAQAMEEHEQRPPKFLRVRVGEKVLTELNFWNNRLGRQNGLPIRDAGHEVHFAMNSDASDLGWGAHLDRE